MQILEAMPIVNIARIRNSKMSTKIIEMISRMKMMIRSRSHKKSGVPA
jgi:hypothetical protein